MPPRPPLVRPLAPHPTPFRDDARWWGYLSRLSSVFERAMEFFGEEHLDEMLFIEFSRFEERQKEVGGARVRLRCLASAAAFLMRRVPLVVRACPRHLQVRLGENPESPGQGTF